MTGATGGMGRAVSLLAASEGYDLLLADLSLPKVEALAADCSRHGSTATCFALDVAQADSIAALCRALAAGNGVDGVIHTVGLSPQMAGWQKIIAVDLVGTVALLEQVRPSMNAGACAVAIASMSAYLVPDNAGIDAVMADPLADDVLERLQALIDAGQGLDHPGLAYAYAKKALKQYVMNRSPDWGREGKRFVSISPGLIDTDMGRLENAAMENFDAMRAMVALDRLGAPEDIAHTALFLVSGKAGYITGCDILVDGGFIANVKRQQQYPA